MEFQLGTETRDKYCAMELVAAAHKAVTEAWPVRPGQNVLITADSSSDSRVVEATAGAAMAVGGIPVVVWFAQLPEPMQQPPAPVAAAAAAAEIWFDFAAAYLLYSPAYHAALKEGCTYVGVAGMDVDMMVRTIGRTRPALLREMMRQLYRMSQEADVIRVAAPGGTDVTLRVDKAGDAFFEDYPEGEAHPDVLLGQSGCGTHRDSYEGVIVYDATLWPPRDIGVLRSPVRVCVEKGLIREITGGDEARILERWLASQGHPEAYRMEHFCYGFNPGVTRPTGRIAEDERIFGCVQFGMGAFEWGSPVHYDGVVLSPSVWLDGVLIEEAGVYVHPELVRLCREMDVPGY